MIGYYAQNYIKNQMHIYERILLFYIINERFCTFNCGTDDHKRPSHDRSKRYQQLLHSGKY